MNINQEVEDINKIEQVIQELHSEFLNPESPQDILSKRISERLNTLSEQYYGDVDDLIYTLEKEFSLKKLSTRGYLIKRLSKLVSKSYDIVVKLFKRDDF